MKGFIEITQIHLAYPVKERMEPEGKQLVPHWREMYDYTAEPDVSRYPMTIAVSDVLDVKERNRGEQKEIGCYLTRFSSPITRRGQDSLILAEPYDEIQRRIAEAVA